MSWQAVERVIQFGPDDAQLWRLLVVVGDLCDARGENASAGGRLLAERCRCSLRTVQRRVARAVAEEWLTVIQDGGPRRRAVYALGSQLRRGQVRNGASQRRAKVVAGTRLERSFASDMTRIGAQAASRTGHSSVHSADAASPPSGGARSKTKVKGKNQPVSVYDAFTWTPPPPNGDP